MASTVTLVWYLVIAGPQGGMVVLPSTFDTREQCTNAVTEYQKQPTPTGWAVQCVPRKSRSPSASTVAAPSLNSSAVTTAFSVTPAQATSASSSMSPEHSSSPEPPVAGCRPAMASARPVSTLQAIWASSSEPLAFKVMKADFGSPL